MAAKKPVAKTTRRPPVKKELPIEQTIEFLEKEVDMKVTKETPKWGSLTVDANNLSFIGEELVDFEITLDEMNPENHKIICINGNQIILGVGEPLQVPKSVYNLFNQSTKETNDAKRKMKQSIEIK